MIDKKSIRKDILVRRAALTPEEVKKRSRVMTTHLLSWLPRSAVRSIFLYAPIRNEPDLTGLIELCPDMIFSMPVVISPTQMEFYAVDASTSYTGNRWGILEPDDKNRGQVSAADLNTLIIKPAVAADVNGYRLGYGAGFYDRYLVDSRAKHMIAVFAEFILPTLPHEKHDIKANFILSEGGVGEC